MELHCSCSTTQSEAQEEVALLPAVVYTIKDKKDYGVMSTMVVHMFSIHSFITWKNRVLLIQQMNYTFSAFIMCLFPEQTIIHGLTTEENKTPTQLWVRGMLQATSNTAASELWEQSTQVCLCIYLIVKKGSWNKTNICHHFLWDFCFRESYICMELTGMGLFLQHHGEFQPTMMLLLFQKQKLILNMTNLFYCSTTLIL